MSTGFAHCYWDTIASSSFSRHSKEIYVQLSLGMPRISSRTLLQIPKFEDAHDPYIKMVSYLHMTYTSFCMLFNHVWIAYNISYNVNAM